MVLCLCVTICLSVYLSTCLSICLFVYLPVCLWQYTCLSARISFSLLLPVYLSAYLFYWMFFIQPIFRIKGTRVLPFCLTVCLSFLSFNLSSGLEKDIFWPAYQAGYLSFWLTFIQFVFSTREYLLLLVCLIVYWSFCLYFIKFVWRTRGGLALTSLSESLSFNLF